jgi:hypothetical protein
MDTQRTLIHGVPITLIVEVNRSCTLNPAAVDEPIKSLVAGDAHQSAVAEVASELVESQCFCNQLLYFVASRLGHSTTLMVDHLKTSSPLSLALAGSHYVFADLHRFVGDDEELFVAG